MNKESLINTLKLDCQMPESKYDEGYNNGILFAVKNIEQLEVPENYHKLNERNKDVINQVINCLVKTQKD